jgi:hypothetical protein
MGENEVVRRTGWFGLLGAVIFACELPLWVLLGSPRANSGSVRKVTYE